ncbi:nucleoporin NUP56 [Rhypophila decipiens]
MMADDPHNTSDISDTVDVGNTKEDAETTAARRELKQTTISEKRGKADKSGSGDEVLTERTALHTPSPENGSPSLDPDDLKEQVWSPKKKRAHDELDQEHEATRDLLNDEGVSKTTSATVPAKSRSVRSEPEKKRARDRQADEEARNSQDEEEPRSDSSARSSLDGKPSDVPGSSSVPENKDKEDEKPKTSASSFASSAFGKLASSSTSPFGALGASSASKPSLFGNTGAASGFGALGSSSNSATTQPKPSFGGATAALSPFGIVNGGGKSVFGGGGSAFGSSFGGSVLGAPRLSSFAKPGEALKSDKPARPFGAPESDAEDDSGEEDQESGNEDGEKDEDKAEEQEAKKELDEKKRVKLHKVEIDNGESNEATLLSLRAKMFQLEKGEGWKERGAGNLKVNVPKASVDFDDAGNPIPGSFDASVLDENDEAVLPQNVRLIMRQDRTGRVILNAPILPAMTFSLDKKLKASYLLFTAFEGTEAKPVQLKMADVNATAVKELVDLIQRGLSDV